LAVAIASSATTVEAGATTITITKPTGLAAGDLMVAAIHSYTIAGTVTPPSGFTQLDQDTNGTFQQTVYWKIADSADAAAANFTWTFQNSNSHVGGLMRITGHDPQSPITTSASDASVVNDQTPDLAVSVTPTYANSLLLLLLSRTGANGTSAYAVATDDPTWTETWDVGDGTMNISAASGPRAQTTATGNASCSGNAATNDWVAHMVVVTPPFAVLTDTVTGTDTVSGNLDSKITDTATATDTTTSTIARLWTKLARAAGAWTNQQRD